MRIFVNLAALLLFSDVAVAQFVPGMLEPEALSKPNRNTPPVVTNPVTNLHSISGSPHSYVRETASWYTGANPVSIPGVPYLGFLGSHMGPDYHHASTALEGQLRGTADVIDALGRHALLKAESRIRNEIAYGLHLENKLRYAATYWAKRELRDIALTNERARKRQRNAESALLSGRRALPAINVNALPAANGLPIRLGRDSI